MTTDAFVAWHREYILGGGIDTYRKNNTTVDLAPEKIDALKEVLSVLAENIKELHDKAKSASDWDLVDSRGGDYMYYAEILSGNPGDKITIAALKEITVEDIHKYIEKINRESGNTAPNEPAVDPVAATNIVTPPVITPSPEPVVAATLDQAAVAQVATPEPTPGQTNELSPEEYNAVFSQMLEKHTAGEQVTREDLIAAGFTEEQADDFMVIIS